MVDQLFAVERYDDSGAALMPPDSFPVLPETVRFAGAVYLPADEVVIAFVEGVDEATVAATVREAGWRVDRISPASWLADREALR